MGEGTYAGGAPVAAQNHSVVSEFIVLGFSTFPQQLLPAIFLLILLMYLFTLLGSLLIMGTVWSERSLHTPVYLFPCALSVSEILFTIAITPRMLADLLSTHHSISNMACAGQMFFFTFSVPHSFLLMALGYDLSAATLQHAHETPWLCPPGGLVLGWWLSVRHDGNLDSVSHHLLWVSCDPLFSLPCAFPLEVGLWEGDILGHWGCDPGVYQRYDKAAHCSSSSPLSPHGCCPEDPCAEGQLKTFSTYASHLTVAVVHCDFASIFYLRPKGAQAVDSDTLMGTTYNVFTPFLSPVIFSLRNKELKSAIKNSFCRKVSPLSS
ncbi:Olfactory receptor 10H4 [Manis javanica]|nr:Olfactory receptor 10H4 [Manis javanica]